MVETRKRYSCKSESELIKQSIRNSKFIKIKYICNKIIVLFTLITGERGVSMKCHTETLNFIRIILQQ